MPLVRGEVDEIHDEVFAEVTYHAAYEPQRAVRTERYKYMRRFDEEHPGRVLANVDDGLTKDVLLAARLGRRGSAGRGALRPVRSIPAEGRNRIDDPALAGVLEDLREPARTTGWSGPTTRCSTDPSRRPRAPCTTPSTRLSPNDPTTPPTTHSLTHTRRARDGHEID